MTKYKLLKPIKNVEWNVVEERETSEAMGTIEVRLRGKVYDVMSPVTLTLLVHAGFIEEVAN